MTILLPPEVDFNNVTVQLINPFYEVPGEEYNVVPAPGKWPDSTKIVDEKDTSIYNRDAFFPAGFKGDVWFDQLYQYKMVCIKIYPYLYNPVRNKLRRLTNGVIEVSFSTGTTSLTVTPAALSKRPLIAGAVNDLCKIAANPEVLETYGISYDLLQSAATSTAAPLAKSKYAIMTTNAIYTACKTDIDAYIGSLSGYTVELVTEGAVQGPNTWENATDVDDRAINIRKWLQDYVNTASPEEWYVLLIGNPNPTEDGVPGDVPMVLKGKFGTDYYYGDLNCELTNLSASGQEVSVGRIPVYGPSDYPRLRSYLSKVITYKSKTVEESRWRRFALLPIKPSFKSEDHDFELGESVRAELEPYGWEYRRLYGAYSSSHYFFGMYPDVVRMNPLPEQTFCEYNDFAAPFPFNQGAPSPFAGTILNWNKYNPGLVLWLTHGCPWHIIDILTSDNLYKLDGGHPAIVFSNSCNVSNAQIENNFGTAVMYCDGAITFIGGTEDLYESQAHDISPRFARSTRDNESVGDALKSICILSPYKSDNKRLALYGCPEVQINLPNSPPAVPGPQTLTATYISNSQIDLSWTPVPDAQKYIIERVRQSAGPTRVDWPKHAEVTAPATTHSDVVDVTADDVYLYRVWAQTSTSTSGYSPVDSASTYDPTLLPIPPTNLQVVADCYSAEISWDPPATIQSGTFYNVKRRYGPGGSYTTIFSTTSTSFIDCQLLNGETFYYTVSTVNKYGESPNCTDEKSATPALRSVASGACPSNIRGESITPNSFNCRWDYPSPEDMARIYTEIRLTYEQDATEIKFERVEKLSRASLQYVTIEKIGSLENNLDVTVELRSCNEAGCSNWCSQTITTLPGTPPGTPINFIVNRTSPTLLQLAYTPASSGNATHGYQIYHKGVYSNQPVSDAKFSLWRTIEDPTITSIEFPTEEGRIDIFLIRAYNENPPPPRAPDVPPDVISWSPFSAEVSSSLCNWPVNEPADLAALCTAANTVGLTWVDRSAGEVGFCLQRQLSGGDWTTPTTINITPGNVSVYTDNSVGENLYEYRIRATLPSASPPWSPGYSEWSNIAAVNTRSDNLPVAEFTKITSFSTTEFVLDWQSNLPTVTGYTIQASLDGSTYTTIATITTGTVTSFTVTPTEMTLLPETDYWFRIRGTNWAGDGPFNEKGPVQTAPRTPTNLTAVAISGSRVNFSWEDKSLNETRFELEGTSNPSDWGGKFYKVCDPDVTATFLSNLDETAYFAKNTQYWFRIKAEHDSEEGSSAYSNVVSVTTLNDPCMDTQNSGDDCLKGVVFGAGPPYGNIQDRVYCMATDNHTSTFYDYAQPDGGFTGLKFDPPRAIEKIRFYPRIGYAGRMAGGVFQGSNTEDFIAPVVLYSIASTPVTGWNEVPSSSSEPFKFVRYLAPAGSFGNIAEMKFYEVPTTYYIRSVNTSTSPSSESLGSITPGELTNVASHANQTFTIAPNPLCLLDDVKVDDKSVGAVSTYTFTNVIEDHTIEAIFSRKKKYEAEDAALADGAKTNTNHPGFSGTGFVDGFYNDENARVTFTVSTDRLVDYGIKLRYSAGNGTSTNVGLYVDDIKIKNITCPGTGNWDTWAEIAESVKFYGFNKVMFKAETSSGNCINLDYIELTDFSPLTITASALHGTITPNGSVKVPYGGSQTFSIVPYFGYEIEAVSVDGVDQGSDAIYTFSNVTRNHTIFAEMAPVDRYEAENGITTGTAKARIEPDVNHTGYSGTGFVDGFWNSDNARWCIDVNIPYNGCYAINLRYSAGNGTSTNMGLYIDDVKIKNTTFAGTGNWNTWADTVEVVELEKGVHSICYRTESAEHECINIDYLSLDYLGWLTYEAEDASLQGSAHENTNHPGFSGQGFVDGFYESDDAKVVFCINVGAAGTYDIKLRYSAGDATSTNVGLYVAHDEDSTYTKIKNITCPTTGNWDTWSQVSETVTLQEGVNWIMYNAETEDVNCINLDKISLLPVTFAPPPSDLKVYILDQTPGSDQQTQPRFYILNEGTIPLSNFTMKYYFTVENEQSPVVESYYMAPYCNVVVTHVSGNNYCAAITFNGTLPANGRIPESDGLNFGLHYANWPNLWNKSNDFSQPPGSSYTLNYKVAIFNSSNVLIYGSEP